MSNLAVYCAGDLVITGMDYSQPQHPRQVHEDGTLCDHAGPVRIGDRREDPWGAFLTARYDEAEALARYAGSGQIAWLTYPRADGQMHYTTVAAGHAGDVWCADGKELPEPASVRVVYDQAQRLADIALKRAILAEHGPSEIEPEACRCCKGCLALPCPTVRHLATEFSGHADYPGTLTGIGSNPDGG